MQEAPPIKLKSPMLSDTRKIKTETVGKKRRDQLRKRKRLIKDLNSPTFPDSKTEPSREFQPFTQAGTKYLENFEVLTVGTSNVKARAPNPR